MSDDNDICGYECGIPRLCPDCLVRKVQHNERNDFKVGIVQSDGRCDRCTWRNKPMTEPEEHYRASIYSENATPGVWYDSSRWGKMLCCGSGGEEWITAFAVRTSEGRTELRFLQHELVIESSVQSWEAWMIIFKIESVDCEAGTVSGQRHTAVDVRQMSSSFGVDDLIGATATAVLRDGVFDLISITASSIDKSDTPNRQ